MYKELREEYFYHKQFVKFYRGSSQMATFLNYLTVKMPNFLQLNRQYFGKKGRSYLFY